MEELRARLEALERRMERAEAALRDRPLTALRLHGVPVLFEDVAVRFSRQEWASLDEGQRELYQSVMEGNYEMLVDLYCALSKPELLLQLEREELSSAPESEREAAEVSPELAVEPAQQNCTIQDALLETETMESGCREPEESRNVTAKSGNLVEESKNLVEESRSPVEISGNLAEVIWDLTEESKNSVEENRSPAEESSAKERGNSAKESGNLMEESGSPVVSEKSSTPAVPLEAAALPVDLSQPSPAPPCPLSVRCWEAVGQDCSPPAAGDAEVGIPTEMPKEEVAAEKPSMPKTPSEGLELDKGSEKEAVKDSGNTGQDLVANIPEEPGKEVTRDVCRTTEQADPSPGQPEKDSCVGQRNATREFYSCPLCRKTFLLKINLLIHQRSHNNWVPYVCAHCDRKFMSKKKIRRHLRAWAVNGTCQPSELEECPSQVPYPASHPQTWAAKGMCQAPKPEECPRRTLCPTSQPQTWAPNGTCQPSDVKVCPNQGQWPASQPQTWAANSTCQASKPEKCQSQTLCPSSQPQGPSRDCGKVWQEPGPARCSLSPGEMYTCNECLETFSNQRFLTVHQRRHSGHHLILCPCCNRSFAWVSDFVRQHWTHMGVRPHQCGICQKTFKRYSHLKEHQRIHRRQERPFTCANPVPVTAAPAAGNGVGSQNVPPRHGALLSDLEVSSQKLEMTSQKLEVSSQKLEVISPKLEVTSQDAADGF